MDHSISHSPPATQCPYLGFWILPIYPANFQTAATLETRPTLPSVAQMAIKWYVLRCNDIIFTFDIYEAHNQPPTSVRHAVLSKYEKA